MITIYKSCLKGFFVPFYRPGVTGGVVGVGKSDGMSQQTGLGIRSSLPRTDSDNSSLINDKRDRPIGSDKERVNPRAVNKYVQRQNCIFLPR